MNFSSKYVYQKKPKSKSSNLTELSEASAELGIDSTDIPMPVIPNYQQQQQQTCYNSIKRMSVIPNYQPQPVLSFSRQLQTPPPPPMPLFGSRSNNSNQITYTQPTHDNFCYRSGITSMNSMEEDEPGLFT